MVCSLFNLHLAPVADRLEPAATQTKSTHANKGNRTYATVTGDRAPNNKVRGANLSLVSNSAGS